jgi:hypothetical protein
MARQRQPEALSLTGASTTASSRGTARAKSIRQYRPSIAAQISPSNCMILLRKADLGQQSLRHRLCSFTRGTEHGRGTDSDVAQCGLVRKQFEILEPMPMRGRMPFQSRANALPSNTTSPSSISSRPFVLSAPPRRGAAGSTWPRHPPRRGIQAGSCRWRRQPAAPRPRLTLITLSTSLKVKGLLRGIC